MQVFAPGTTPAYSNYGISLAGYIVQQVSGEKFENYLDKHVFEPAGMTSSTFHQPLPAELADRMAHGYQTNGGPAQPFEVVVSSPAGAMTTSGADAARFMLAQLGQSQGSPLLQDSTWQQMQSQASYTEPLGTLAKGDHMGLVYWDLSRNGHRIVGHGGDTLAFHTMLEIYPDDNTGVFISMNAAGKNGAPGTIREDLMRAFSDRYFPGEQTDAGKAPTAEESQQHATTVAGNYATTRSSYTTFLSTMNGLSSSWTNISALTNGHLLVKAEGATTEYEEIEPWVWREVGGSRRLPVQVEDGKVVRIGIAPAMSIAPVTPAQAALVPVVLASGAALLLLIIAWPVDGIRRWWTTRQGHAVLGGCRHHGVIHDEHIASAATIPVDHSGNTGPEPARCAGDHPSHHGPHPRDPPQGRSPAHHRRLPPTGRAGRPGVGGLRLPPALPRHQLLRAARRYPV